MSHQDFTGVPCVVDLAAMRDAIKRLGGDPNKINPLVSGVIKFRLSSLIDSSNFLCKSTIYHVLNNLKYGLYIADHRADPSSLGMPSSTLIFILL